jgi:choline dehydrogenase
MSGYAGNAFSSIGIPPAQDFSSGYLMGAQYCPLTASSPNEERSSSQASFLEAASGRTNLKVFTYTLAKRILFDNAKRAVGVEVQSANTTTTFSLSASKEVILSAGAVSEKRRMYRIS